MGYHLLEDSAGSRQQEHHGSAGTQHQKVPNQPVAQFGEAIVWLFAGSQAVA